MKIAIVGCGWVGVRLAAFLKEKNHQVIVTTTTTDKLEYLRLVAPEAYLFDFTNPQEVPEREQVQHVPHRRADDVVPRLPRPSLGTLASVGRGTTHREYRYHARDARLSRRDATRRSGERSSP